MTSLHEIIVRPIITEKSSRDQALGKYWFIVAPASTKIDVRNAVEKIYKVRVIRVNVSNLSGKVRRLGRTVGRKPKRRRAVVTLAAGDKIEMAAA